MKLTLFFQHHNNVTMQVHFTSKRCTDIASSLRFSCLFASRGAAYHYFTTSHSVALVSHASLSGCVAKVGDGWLSWLERKDFWVYSVHQPNARLCLDPPSEVLGKGPTVRRGWRSVGPSSSGSLRPRLDPPSVPCCLSHSCFVGQREVCRQGSALAPGPLCRSFDRVLR